MHCAENMLHKLGSRHVACLPTRWHLSRSRARGYFASPSASAAEARENRAELPTGVNMHWRESGPQNCASVVLCLHGFPDCSLTWRYQVAPLAAAGHRVVCVDLRGYPLSPVGLNADSVDAYGAEQVTGDLIALLDALDTKTAALVVGHDWGANVAWHLALRAPHRVARLATINVPHPIIFADTLRSNVNQLLKSWYIGAFQVPLLPEVAMQADNCRILRNLLATDALQAVPADVVEQYVQQFSRPGAFTGPVNYYRAAARGLWAAPRGVYKGPVTVLWGEQDPYLDASMADVPSHLAPRARVVRLPQATHWVHWDEPERVSSELLALLGQQTTD